jgi:hypothetical protein
MKDEIRDRLDKNLSRVRNLVSFFEHYVPKETKRVKHTDILRAAIVFLHATLDISFAVFCVGVPRQHRFP